MRIRNLRSFAVEIPDVGWVESGDDIDVPDDLANGTPATGVPAEEDIPALGVTKGEPDPRVEGYHPGSSGLLAQTDAWEAVKGKKPHDTPADAGKEG